MEHMETGETAPYSARANAEYYWQSLHLSGAIGGSCYKAPLSHATEKGNQEALATADSWQHNADSGCLWLHGPCGTGKTHLGYMVLHNSCPNFSIAEQSCSEIDYKMVNALVRPELLLLDDIDKGHPSTSYLNTLWRIANTRWQNGGRTIITSQFSPQQFKQWWTAAGGGVAIGQSFFDRLVPAEVVEVTGKSLRRET